MLALALSLVLGLQDRPPGLSTPVELRAPAGPLLDALRILERDARIPFAVLPELLPPDLKIAGFSHSGPLADGLDRLLRPLGLRWDVGELGGIVVLPAETALPSFDDWAAKSFDAVGIELVDVERQGHAIGLRKGDVITEVDGAAVGSYEGYRDRVIRHVQAGRGAELTLRRGAETLKLRANPDPRSPFGSLGVRRNVDAPSDDRLYEKSGHRDPAWDEAFLRAAREYRTRSDADWNPDVVLKGVQEAIRAGCRDPLLAGLLIRHVRDFRDERWAELEAGFDADRLRGAYGGTKVLARAEAAAEFLMRGSPLVRDRARRLVECAWAATRRPSFGYALAVLRFLEADDDAALRLLDRIREPLAATVSLDRASWPLLESQILQRQGRLDDAYARAQDLAAKSPLNPAKQAAAFQSGAFGHLQQVWPKTSRDRLEGDAGLVAWRGHSALDALFAAWKADRRFSLKDPGPGRFSPDLVAAPVPLSMEVFFFPRMIKTYDSFGYSGTVCVAFGATPGPPIVWTRSSTFRLDVRLNLTRHHGALGQAGEIPLVGFANGGDDALRIYKSPDFVTLRSNGAWITTDSAAALEDPGDLALAVTTAKGTVDVGILIPTPRPYDNDRIRDLMERIRRADSSPEEKVKAWDEAAALSPPKSVMRNLIGLVPPPAREKVPAPALEPDAPPLGEFGLKDAEARFRERGPAGWIAADPEEPDLVWCGRPDGRVEAMSLRRRFTTTFPPLRAGLALGKPLFLKDAVWFPSPRGLFRHDRAAGVFRTVPLGGIFSDLAIESVAREKSELVVVAGRRWSLPLR